MNTFVFLNISEDNLNLEKEVTKLKIQIKDRKKRTPRTNPREVKDNNHEKRTFEITSKYKDEIARLQTFSSNSRKMAVILEEEVSHAFRAAIRKIMMIQGILFYVFTSCSVGLIFFDFLHFALYKYSHSNSSLPVVFHFLPLNHGK